MKKFLSLLLASSFFTFSLNTVTFGMENKESQETKAVQEDEPLPKYAKRKIRITFNEHLKEFVKNKKENGEWVEGAGPALTEGSSYLYLSSKEDSVNNSIVVALLPGHGAKTNKDNKAHYVIIHPKDKSGKVTGGSTKKGKIEALCENEGMSFDDGTFESVVNLKVANFLKELLLEEGYNVLMLRDEPSTQLDVPAKCIIASNFANLMISIHFDAPTEGIKSNKGAFYLSVPEEIKNSVKTYQDNNALGKTLIVALTSIGFNIFGKGDIPVDLMQWEYADGIPNTVVKLGNTLSKIDDASLDNYAMGLCKGIDAFCKENYYSFESKIVEKGMEFGGVEDPKKEDLEYVPDFVMPSPATLNS